jgi:hypothetical protein
VEQMLLKKLVNEVFVINVYPAHLQMLSPVQAAISEFRRNTLGDVMDCNILKKGCRGAQIADVLFKTTRHEPNAVNQHPPMRLSSIHMDFRVSTFCIIEQNPTKGRITGVEKTTVVLLD